MTKHICVIEGDDAAPEAVRPTVELLEAMELDIELLRPLTGKEAFEAEGIGFPAEAAVAVDQADATLFGSASDYSEDAISYLRYDKGTYANVRPVKWLTGYRSPLSDPTGIDYVIVRENLEDVYVGIEGDLASLADTPLTSRAPEGRFDPTSAGAYALKVITEANTRRVAEFSCELALRRKEQGRPGIVTCVAKHNVLLRTDGLFRDVTRSVVDGYEELAYSEYFVDNFGRLQVETPQDLDVVVTPNLYGDIVSDVGAGTIGGLGLTPSGCYGEEYAYFEAVHGTAPDIEGMGIINPTATIMSAAMMLEYLGMSDAASRLQRAVALTYEDGSVLTPDQGGSATTTEFCNAVRGLL